MAKVKSVIDTILGEATHGSVQQRFTDMVNIASVIANRAAQTRTTPQQVVSVRSEFNAYGKPLPSGAGAYRSLAQKAWDQVQNTGPVHNATFYATPAATKNLPRGLQQVASTSGHVYFSDPQNRAIRTAVGVVKPVANAVARATDAVTAPVRQVAANIGNMASAMRTAAFAPSAPSIPSPPSNYDLPARPMADIGYRMGSKRPNPPSPDLVSRLQTAATDVLGPNVRVDITSGQGQHGSSRHRDPHGIAADVKVFDRSTGKYISDPRSMMAVAQAFSAQGGKGVGYGPEYMGYDTMHLDTAKPGRGQDNEWGSIGNANKELLADARNSALMPASFYDRKLPQSMPAPPSRQSAPAALAAAPKGTVERAALPSVTQRQAAPYQDYAATRMAPAAPNSGMSLADQYAAYGAGKVPPSAPAMAAVMSPQPSPISQAKLMPASMVVPNFVPATPAPPPVQPPVQTPPVPVVTPTVPRLKTPQTRIDEAFAQAAPPPTPRFTAADVYAGRAQSGQATGGNTVSRDPFGNISVTNRFGATTTTGPDGRQMAGSPFGGGGIGGPLGPTPPSSPTAAPDVPRAPSQFGNTVRGGVGTVLGGGLGGLLAGPIGAALGAVVARDLAVGKNPIDRLGIGTFSVPVTDRFGFTQNMTFANAKSGGPFPDRPTGQAGALGGKDSNRSERSMREISPAATRDIKSGKSGLF